MITKPEPRHVVQMVPYDDNGKVLVMHRSDKVRSARNVWSFPSGLHKIGETWQQCAHRELEEEYGLEIKELSIIGLYENIAGDKELDVQSHWVILLVAAKVECVHKAINRQPDRHDKMSMLPISVLEDTDNFVAEYPFHISFTKFFVRHSQAIIDSLRKSIAS